jgi:lipoprotein NlpI
MDRRHTNIKRITMGLITVIMLVSILSCTNRAEKLYEQGEYYYKTGLLDEAIIKFKATTQIEPKHSSAHHFLALAFMRKEWYDYALVEAEITFDLKPTSEIYELVQLARSKAEEKEELRNRLLNNRLELPN